ncbi:MAG: 3-dehydroquinate synthase, partial [Oscillospiraceae bacterium]|nr:3-dehydroquinate synthase [Oscillospiraceae bacterium]
YMRGVPFVQIPTTLLSQVDSSVGGKTAVNLPQGKNLVGAFYQPKLVLADTATLTTLNDREFAGGMAEVIKYGAIYSEAFLQKLQEAKNRAGAMQQIEEIVYACCDFKRAVVEKDEFDNGERALLNFGHTFGHTIEKLGNFTDYIHGEAVALGMVLAALYGENLGLTTIGTAKQLYDICVGYGLPVQHEVHPLQMAPLFHLDKKASGKTITLILAQYAGKCFAQKQTLESFEAAMQQLEQTLLDGAWSK